MLFYTRYIGRTQDWSSVVGIEGDFAYYTQRKNSHKQKSFYSIVSLFQLEVCLLYMHRTEGVYGRWRTVSCFTHSEPLVLNEILCDRPQRTFSTTNSTPTTNSPNKNTLIDLCAKFIAYYTLPARFKYSVMYFSVPHRYQIFVSVRCAKLKFPLVLTIL